MASIDKLGEALTEVGNECSKSVLPKCQDTATEWHR